MDEVFVLSGVRTAVGAFGGALKDTPPTELAAQVSTEAIRRSGLEAAAIGHAVFGQVIQTEPRDAYLARWAALESGCAVETPALVVNRLCGSGLQAVVSAAQVLRLGEADTALAGGAESMSRAPYLVPAARFGAKMGDAALVDGLTGALTDPFNRYHMGMTAENVAERYGIDRAVQDDIAHESHRRASAADREGRFVDQIQPIQVKQKGKPIIFDRDEHIRHDASRADFERLKPVFKTGGSVTAGNASGINDGAAALVLAGEATVKRLALTPTAMRASARAPMRATASPARRITACRSAAPSRSPSPAGPWTSAPATRGAARFSSPTTTTGPNCRPAGSSPTCCRTNTRTVTAC